MPIINNEVDIIVQHLEEEPRVLFPSPNRVHASFNIKQSLLERYQLERYDKDTMDLEAKPPQFLQQVPNYYGKKPEKNKQTSQIINKNIPYFNPSMYYRCCTLYIPPKIKRIQQPKINQINNIKIIYFNGYNMKRLFRDKEIPHQKPPPSFCTLFLLFLFSLQTTSDSRKNRKSYYDQSQC